MNGYHFRQENLIAIRIKISGSEVKHNIHEEETVDQIVKGHDENEVTELK